MQSLPEIPPLVPIAIPISAQDSHSGFTSKSSSPMPHMLKLNPESLVESGLVTTNTSRYRLATLTPRQMQESTRCLQPSAPLIAQDVCSTAFLLQEAALTNSSHWTPNGSTSVAAPFLREPRPLGRNLAVRGSLTFIAPKLGPRNALKRAPNATGPASKGRTDSSARPKKTRKPKAKKSTEVAVDVMTSSTAAAEPNSAAPPALSQAAAPPSPLPPAHCPVRTHDDAL